MSNLCNVCLHLRGGVRLFLVLLNAFSIPIATWCNIVWFVTLSSSYTNYATCLFLFVVLCCFLFYVGSIVVVVIFVECPLCGGYLLRTTCVRRVNNELR